MKLSDAAVRNAKANGKVQKLSDGGGLCLHVTATGSKLWRLAYRFEASCDVRMHHGLIGRADGAGDRKSSSRQGHGGEQGARHETLHRLRAASPGG